MDESNERQQLKDVAIAFAKANKKLIAAEIIKKYQPDEHPVSVFMAGSPGAGKTESSLRLIESLSGPGTVLRIDSDEYRQYFDDYNGTNSSFFQAATSILADKVHDLALENQLSFVFDGTFTNFERSEENIRRSLKKDRPVYVLYVYQDPLQAWKFVQRRAEKDGRTVPPHAFIEQYFSARQNVNRIKEMFGKKIQVDLVVKNIDGTDFRYKENVLSIDSHLKESYSKEELRTLIV